MSIESRRRRRSGPALVVIAAAAVTALLVTSAVIDDAAPPGDPLWYMVGAGLVIGTISAPVYAALRRRQSS